jgi:hypothetical protein
LVATKSLNRIVSAGVADAGFDEISATWSSVPAYRPS